MSQRGTLSVASLALLGLLSSCASSVKPPPPPPEKKLETFPHARLDNVLKKFNKGGFVDYAALKKDRKELEDYVGLVAKISPRSKPELFPNRDHELAYWINAYNALVLYNVTERFPEIEDVTENAYKFFRDTFTVGGEEISLEKLEKEWILKGGYNDPRVHFALNCASFSCPRLPEEAFDPERLQEQLDRETRKFMAEDRNAKVEGDKVIVSTLFKDGWYQNDFVASTLPAVQKAPTPEDKVLAYVNHYRADGAKITVGKEWELEFRDYDWFLNDQERIKTRSQ